MTTRSNTQPPTWITGVGAVTGYGWSRKHLWDGLVEGESAVRKVDGFGEDFFDDPDVYLSLIPDVDTAEEGSKFARAFRSSAREAIEDAQARGWKPGKTVGIVHALVLGEVDLWHDFYVKENQQVRRRRYVEMMPSTPVAALSMEYGFHGPSMGVIAMCASGNAALLTAKAWIDGGICDDVIVVATDVSAIPANAKHFADLGVLIPDEDPFQASRPFQEGSRGFVGGEASVGLVVSSRREGGYVRFRGGAMTHDSFSAVSIDPELAELERCFTEGLENAGVKPEEVVYLNAHGPGTKQCDAAEAAMLDKLLPDAQGVFSFKPLVGHCQGAAAALEVAITCLSYEKGVIPAPPQVAEGHPRLVSGLTPRKPGVTVKSSIGMGGHNTMVVLDEA